ncbi:hypothetical protein H2199_004603 [Coniosporium tulheliwenetii]|uniref:Uncharacterized protein n=1 Tax=Coniosporium tulheliwenetii TaxID=3383036 RepID=A0ACC2Z6T0_9PEZI|nr:hypothetical protein H2199_004603 [Cladosporium sp. JES 115]
MPLRSDLTLEVSKFAPEAIDEKTRKLNEHLIEVTRNGPRWYEVGAAKYRKMRWAGETPFPKPVVLDSGIDMTLPSREAGREIPCRMFKPPQGKDVKGVVMHIHGGGWVLNDEKFQDYYLKFMADNADMVVISVGYRLAPEHPFPQGPEDCYDVAEYLVQHGKSKYGGDLAFIGGESAGAHLAVLTTFHLLSHPPYTSSPTLRGLLLHFGAYDLTDFLPQAHHFDKPLILDYNIMSHFLSAFLPSTTSADRRSPSISPFYQDLNVFRTAGGSKLPPALFTCGTEDCLLDDTVVMASKWLMAGAEATVRIYPGAPHGFIMFPPSASPAAGEGLEATREFMAEVMGRGGARL